jgi:Flp pilus assembly protein TadB
VSQERRRAREARLEARRRELEAAAKARARRERREATRERLKPALPRRTRRFGMLSTRALIQVVVLYLAAQACFWVLVEDTRTRIGLALVSLGFTLVLVRTRKRTSR